MGQFSKVLLAINNAHTVPQRDLDCDIVIKSVFSNAELQHILEHTSVQ